MDIQDALTLTQAAERLGITRQGLYTAIKIKRLKANKTRTHWYVLEKDLDEYVKQKYSRRPRKKDDGTLAWDPEKGQYTVTQVAKLLGCTCQRVYHLLRMKKLKSERIGYSYIVKIDDVAAAKKILR